MGWKFVKNNIVIISIENECELDLAHNIIDTVADYYLSEV